MLSTENATAAPEPPTPRAHTLPVAVRPLATAKSQGAVIAQAPALYPRYGLAHAMEIANTMGEFTAECSEGGYFDDYVGR